MSYESLETSVQDGAPRELYVFTVDDEVVGRYTSGESGVTVDGDLYESSPHARGKIGISGEKGREGVKVTVDRDHPIAQRLTLRPRTGVVGCVIHRYHRDDASDRIIQYAGRVMSARRDKNGARILSIEPISVGQQRIGLHRVAQPACNLQLYGPLCRLNMYDWAHDTTITGVNGYALSVASVESGLPYVGGIVEYTAADGLTEYAYIEEVSGLDLTLDLPLYDAAATDAVTIYPGCDWTMKTCHEVYGNSPNYGGRLNIPDINPVTSSAF